MHLLQQYIPRKLPRISTKRRLAESQRKLQTKTISSTKAKTLSETFNKAAKIKIPKWSFDLRSRSVNCSVESINHNVAAIQVDFDNMTTILTTTKVKIKYLKFLWLLLSLNIRKTLSFHRISATVSLSNFRITVFRN